MSNVRVATVPGLNGPISAPPPVYMIGFTNTVAALGTTGYLPAIKGAVRFVTITSGAETIKVSGSKDNVNFTDLYPIDETTGNTLATVQLTTGSLKYWRLKARDAGAFRFFKFTKSAAVQSGTVFLTCISQEVIGGANNLV